VFYTICVLERNIFDIPDVDKNEHFEDMYVRDGNQVRGIQIRQHQL
jgi:hypothetical protein